MYPLSVSHFGNDIIITCRTEANKYFLALEGEPPIIEYFNYTLLTFLEKKKKKELYVDYPSVYIADLIALLCQRQTYDLVR